MGATSPLVLTPTPGLVVPTGDHATLIYDNRVRAYLAFTVFIGFLLFIFFVTVRPAQLPGDTLGIILGAFISLNGVVVGYYYQSSSGSTAKNPVDKPPIEKKD